MRSNQVSIGQSILADQYNSLRKDAYGGSMLLAHEQGTSNMTLAVEAGVCYVGATRVIFAGGNSPSFAAPTTNPRIDILTIDSAGVLAITQGAEAASPVAPAYPSDKLVLCEVYNRVGETSIKDASDGTNGYIYNDVRSFLGGAYIANANQIADGIIAGIKIVAATITADKLAQSYVQTTGNETINGIKTFGSIPVLPASNPTSNNQAARKQYVDDNLGSVTVSDTPAISANTTRAITTGTYTKYKEIAIKAAGTYRVYFEIRNTTTSGTTYGKVYKNGSAIGTERSNATTSFAGSSEDFTFVIGDLVQFYGYKTIDNGEVQYFQLRAVLIPSGTINQD